MVGMAPPDLSKADIALIVAGVGKFFIEVADSMPPPAPDAGYFTRWFYGLMQKLASNGMKAEAARTNIPLSPPTSPITSKPLENPATLKQE